MKSIINYFIFLCLLNSTFIYSQATNFNQIDPSKLGKMPIEFLRNNIMEEHWYPLAGSMRQIAAQGGQVWAIGTNMVGSDRLNYEVYYLNENQNWQLMPGLGIKIAITSRNEPWLINAKHEIYKGIFTPENKEKKASVIWQRMPGEAMDIDACFDGVYILTTEKIAGSNDYKIASWNERSWVNIPDGAGVKIAVDHQFQPWIINSSDEVYQKTSVGWVKKDRKASDIDIDTRGRVFIADMQSGRKTYGYPISYLNSELKNSFWEAIGGEVIQIAADINRIIVINNLNQVFMRYYKSEVSKSPREIVFDKEIISNLCPKGNGALDFNGAPKVYLNSELVISPDSSRVYVQFQASFIRVIPAHSSLLQNSDIEVKSEGTWRIPIGPMSSFGEKYSAAKFINTPLRRSSTIVQLNNSGFNEINNGCDGQEEIFDLSKLVVRGRDRSVIDELRVVGDTGGNDVSVDDDCHCDTRINSIRFLPIKLTLSPR